LTSALPIRRDQFDVVFVSEFLVERVRVIGFVADEAGGQFVEEGAGGTSSTRGGRIWPYLPRRSRSGALPLPLISNRAETQKMRSSHLCHFSAADWVANFGSSSNEDCLYSDS
jgi:hypothetical protein